MQKIYITIEREIEKSKSAEYKKGLKDAMNIVKEMIDPVMAEVVENTIWQERHQN